MGRGITRNRRAVTRPAPTWPAPIAVATWMESPVVTVRPDARVEDAAALMRRRRIRHLPVVDAGGRLVGIVTDRDLRQVLFDPAILDRPDLARTLQSLTVREVMTWGVVTVRPDTDVREAARLMHERKIGALPVVDGGRVVGILTEGEVLRVLQALLRQHVTTVRPLAEAPPARQDYEYGFAPPASGDEESGAPG